MVSQSFTRLLLLNVIIVSLRCTLSLCSKAELSFYLYDLRYTAQLSRQDAFEHTHLVAVLSGIANRNSATLYTLLIEADSQWKDYLTSPNQWLDGAQFVTIDNLTDLVLTFRALLSGVVLYDPAVYATSNVASTAGGVYDALPVCYRPNDPSSLFNVLVGGASKLRLPVVLSLVGLFNGSVTGSAKCDAYMWAKERYV